MFLAFLNASTVASDLSILLVDSKPSLVNKTQDVTLTSTTMWDGLQSLQEIVTPSPVESANSEEMLLDEETIHINGTESTTKLKEDVDVITELKDDIPSVDKFVRAGKAIEIIIQHLKYIIIIFFSMV